MGSSYLPLELRPYPGRVATVSRMVLATVLTMLLVMVFQLPNGFLAVFYAFAVPRKDLRTTVRNGIAMALANMAGIAVSLTGIALFIDYLLLHFLFVLFAFFVAFFLTRILANYAAALGFGVIVVAAASVDVIWSLPNPLRPDPGSIFWSGFGMMLGALVTLAIEWLAGSPMASDRHETQQRLLVPDAFANPEYLIFALKGTLAAAICYLVWTALAWPGSGVCTVTCLLAAPPTIRGSSRQKLLTHLAGLLFGGVVCGIGSQIWVLPTIDSIFGFTLAFAVVSAIAAWASTASPRFSYFGGQMALAYYLTIFQGFGVNPSLAMSRDRLMGILLGILTMYLVYDVGPPWLRSVLPWGTPIRSRLRST
ncbi:MAG TPA: FUSC family protein [Bryobacteraceae bacterium]